MIKESTEEFFTKVILEPTKIGKSYFLIMKDEQGAIVSRSVISKELYKAYMDIKDKQ